MRSNKFIVLYSLLSTVFALAAANSMAGDAKQYSVVRVSPVVDSSSLNYSNAFLLNEAGQITGDLYLDNQRMSWLSDGYFAQTLGDMSAFFPGPTSRWFSSPYRMNEAGQVLGYAHDFGTSGGAPVWLFDGTTTSVIGLVGVDYKNSSNALSARPIDLNENGQAIGYSDAIGLPQGGTHSWFFNGTTTRRIGLTDADHTSDSGHQYSSAVALSNTGHVVGYARRDIDGRHAGYSTWLFNGKDSIDISLGGTAYTRSDGYRYSMPAGINDAGLVVGTNNRYISDQGAGVAAWIYDGKTTTEIGLSGAEFGGSGISYSKALEINQGGQVVGYTDRMNGGVSIGRAAWVYEKGVNREVGIATISAARTAGWTNSEVVALNENGQVAGNSAKYRPGEWDPDQWTWFDNGTDTRVIGLVDGLHTRNDGRRVGEVISLNDAGQVVGNSDRFNGSIAAGKTAWFYDSLLDITYALEFSVSTTGYAYSEASFLGADGLVLGSYDLFNGSDFLGSRGFAWTQEAGFIDLTDAVVGGVGPEWSVLDGALLATNSGMIMGNSYDANGQRSTWLLTPVPEPQTYALMLAGLGLIVGAVRRRGQ